MSDVNYIVRTRMSGVWVCAQQARIPDGAPHGQDAMAITGRRLYSWSGAGELTQVAVAGVEEARIGPPAVCVILRWSDIAEVQVMTAEAVACIDQIPVWTGK